MPASGPFDAKKLYSIKEVADRFRVTPMSVLRWIRSGKLPAFVIGGAIRVYGSDLIAAATQYRAQITAPVEKPQGPREPPKRRR